MPAAEFETIQRRGDGTTCSALACGLDTNPDGPLVILLHGFPDSARTYRLQLPELEAAGYRAVAPVLRGYEPSSQPDDGDYSIRTFPSTFRSLSIFLFHTLYSIPFFYLLL